MDSITSTPCLICHHSLKEPFLDLGAHPLANAYLTKAQLNSPETRYPLEVYFCTHCYLVQIRPVETPENLFCDYAYFSSYSQSWLQHAEAYAQHVIERFHLASHSQVIEIASNDGYLLQYFKAKGLPILGIEPAANIAKIAIEREIPSRINFFSTHLAKHLLHEGITGDLIIANNVLAHVPNPNDFVQGIKILLNPHGIVTLEFPHLLRLMEECQFDTIYHEHFSYLSLSCVANLFHENQLEIFDVEKLSTHGGSLRIFASHPNAYLKTPQVSALLGEEEKVGIKETIYYENFGNRVETIKQKILKTLTDLKAQNKTLVGYGAPAKGNTLLNYCGIGTDFLDYTVDRNPYKQGKFLPGSHIPIETPEKIMDTKPDYVFILPWNLKTEIIEEMSVIYDWGGKFLIPIPTPQVIGNEVNQH